MMVETGSPSAEAEVREHEITITVKEHPKNTLFLREGGGICTFGDEGTARVKIEFSNIIPAGWCVRVGDGPFLTLDWESIARAVVGLETRGA